MHALERIERDGMKPVSRVAWLWRVNREWHPGSGKRHAHTRESGHYYSTPARHKRQDVLADGVSTRVIRPGSRPTGRSTAIRRLMAATRKARPETVAAVLGTYANHLRTCQTCGTGGSCEYARERYGA